MEQELFALMNQMGKRNHRTTENLIKLLEDSAFPPPNKVNPSSWPKYKGPLSEDTRSLGESYLIV